MVVKETLFGREETCVGGTGHFLVGRHLPFSHVVFADVIELQLFLEIVLGRFERGLWFLRRLASDFGLFVADPLRDLDHGFFCILFIGGHFVDELDSGIEILIKVIGHSEVFDFGAVVFLPVSEFLIKVFDVLD